jgi:thiol-disulfide isomerase/thioredoxin
MRRSDLAVAAALLLASSPAAADDAPAHIAEVLRGRLVQRQAGRLVAVPPPQTRYVAFYFGASWCAPCRALMPELHRRYARLRAAGASVEFVFFSEDGDCRRMADYVASARMPWPVIACRDRARLAWLQRSRGSALPGLLVYGVGGRQVISSWSQNGLSRPIRALDDLETFASGSGR